MASLIPRNYPTTVAAAQVAQFIEGGQMVGYDNLNTALDTVAYAQPGSATIDFEE